MLTVDMYQHLLKPYRHLAWLARFERPTGPDLYVWTGSHHHTYGGNLYYGYGYLTSIEPMKKGEGTHAPAGMSSRSRRMMLRIVHGVTPTSCAACERWP